jgi:uncharacterized damage-inducible protein DinB
MAEERRKLYGGTLPGYPEEIGRWLWALEEARSLTIRSATGLDRRTLEWGGPRGEENSISTLLYHIAIVEIDWLYMDLHEGTVPESLRGEFPFPFSTSNRLTVVTGVSVEDHLARLERTRKVFLDDMATHSLESWRRPRRPPKEDYEVTPAWVVYHLIEHESGHAFQIRAITSRAARHFSAVA